jgi:hypothetical protein
MRVVFRKARGPYRSRGRCISCSTRRWAQSSRTTSKTAHVPAREAVDPDRSGRLALLPALMLTADAFAGWRIIVVAIDAGNGADGQAEEETRTRETKTCANALEGVIYRPDSPLSA